jgi:hypothetical protein
MNYSTIEGMVRQSMNNPLEENHLSEEMVQAIYDNGPENTKEAEKKNNESALAKGLDKDIEIYKKAISFCKNDILKGLLKDSLIRLQERRIDVGLTDNQGDK